jgi:hypothetical protein
MEKTQMRDEYDFSKAKPNPYIEKLREQSTIRTDAEAYLKNRTDETGMTNQFITAVPSPPEPVLNNSPFRNT